MHTPRHCLALDVGVSVELGFLGFRVCSVSLAMRALTVYLVGIPTNQPTQTSEHALYLAYFEEFPVAYTDIIHRSSSLVATQAL